MSPEGYGHPVALRAVRQKRWRVFHRARQTAACHDRRASLSRQQPAPVGEPFRSRRAARCAVRAALKPLLHPETLTMKNLVILIGNLGKSPELRNTGKSSVANFSIATKETYTDAEGKRQSSTEWHNVSVFGGLADTVAKHLKKGSKVSIEGRLRTRKWEDKEGVTRYSTEVIANEVIFLDAKPNSAVEPVEPAEAAA